MITNPVHRTLGALAALLTCCVVLASCQPRVQSTDPREFETRWHDLLQRRDYAATEQLIAAREKAIPDDPEATIARANLFYRRATAGAKPLGKGADSTATLDTLLARRALDTLRDGIAKHPDRLDIRLGLAYLCQQLGLRPAEVEVVGGTIDYAKAHPTELRWNYGEPLQAPADKFVPQVLRDYVRYYVDRGAPGDDEAMFALARLIMAAYPNSAFVPNDVAFWYAQHGDWQRSLEYLQVAAHADSSDALVLYNVGWANERLKRREPALRWYRRALLVAAAGQQGEIVQSSRERLAALGASASMLATPARPAAVARTPRPAATATPVTPTTTPEPQAPPPTTPPATAPEPATPDTAHATP